MKRITYLLLAFLLWNGTLIYAQENDTKMFVGITCSTTPNDARPVSKIANYINTYNFKAVVNLLYSRNTPEQFLAAVVCEELMKQNRIRLKPVDQKKITDLYQYNEMVMVCPDVSIPMSDILNAKDSAHVRAAADSYFKEMITVLPEKKK